MSARVDRPGSVVHRAGSPEGYAIRGGGSRGRRLIPPAATGFKPVNPCPQFIHLGRQPAWCPASRLRRWFGTCQCGADLLCKFVGLEGLANDVALADPAKCAVVGVASNEDRRQRWT